MISIKPRQIYRQSLLVALLAVLFCLPLSAQYTPPYVGLTGVMGSSNGMPASNYIITISPSQVMYVGGTAIVVANANCGTDANGTVVGTPNPLTAAVPSATPGTGTLPAGNYYIKVTWYDAFAHQTLPSPEVQIQLTATGEIVIGPPAGGAPLSAVGMDVYIGTSSGAETYQGQTTNPAQFFTQSTALATGATPPISNNTVCMVVANDAAWPIGGYSFNITTAGGNTVPGFPQQVQFIGPGSAFNLSNGIPQWNGRATYPVPILTLPYNHNAQSISGPLSMTGYNIYNVGALGVGTATPGYGVDVEGTPGTLPAEINANGGYWVNGLGGAPSTTQCLASVNAGPFNTPVTCLTAAPTVYYQQMVLRGGVLPQEEALNFIGNYFTMADNAPNGQTNVGLVTLGTDTKLLTASASGTSGDVASWDSNGGIGDSNVPVAQLPNTRRLKLTSGFCSTSSTAWSECTIAATWPLAFADTNYIVNCTGAPPSGTVSAGAPFLQFYASGYSTTGFTITVQNGDTTAAVITTPTEIDCLGTHL